MNTAMKTFVSKDQKLTGTDITGVNDPCLRVFMENPNSYTLFFPITISTITKILERNILIITLDLVVKKPLSLESESKFHKRVEKEKKAQGEIKEKE